MRLGAPERVVAERDPLDAPFAERFDQCGLGGAVVDRHVVVSHDRRDLLGRERVGERSERLDRVLCRRAALESRVEVRDADVVGLDRLEAAGLELATVLCLEDQRRRRVAHRAVGLACLALELGRAALGVTRLVAVGLERGHGLGVVDRGDHRVGVDSLDA